MSRIRVTIDALALKGLAPEQRRALVEGLQGELSRVLADPARRDERAGSRRMPVLRLGQMAIEPGASGGRKLGSGMGRGIAKGMKP
jgi:hypothetical protein